MLLDIYLHEAESQKICVTSACMAAGVAQSTAQGWVVRLVREKLLIKVPDPTDGRRSYLKLSPETKANLCQWLITLAEAIKGIETDAG